MLVDTKNLCCTSHFLLGELIDNSNGVCPLKNAKINELSDVRAQILYEKDFYKSHLIPNLHRLVRYAILRYDITISSNSPFLSELPTLRVNLSCSNTLMRHL